MSMETFIVPDGYDMVGTEFGVSVIKVEDHPDGSGDGVLTYDLYHEEDVDSEQLVEVVNQLMIDALKRQIKETEIDESKTRT